MRLPALAAWIVLWAGLPPVRGGKVLVFPLDGSHWVNMKVLIEELHARGHSITVVRPSVNWYIKAESPFYTSITMPTNAGLDKEVFGSYVKRTLAYRRQGASIWARVALEIDLLQQFYYIHKDLVEAIGRTFDNEELMASLREAEYDVVLSDPASGGGALMARKLGVPQVFNVRWTVQGEGHQSIAPSPLSYVPIPGSELTDKMTFSERLKNVLMYAFTRLQVRYVTDSTYLPFVHRYFGPDVHYMELFQDADIWLMRNDFIFEFPRPTMPNIVYMAGFQCKPSEPLPRDLDSFVESSGEHGVIVMSLGTLVEHLPDDVAEEIAAAFARLPQKVVWRHAGTRPAALGNNTFLLDWMPQNDLLGHPKTKVFVAHGGTNGVQEAIYHGVPILGLPLMFDQSDNLSRMKAKGVAKVVDIAYLNRDNFLEALREVLEDPSYRENMQRLSRLHKDQPMMPLDKAMFWIEYVMRHKGAPHLRTQSFRMSWIQYHSVDVIATLLAAILLVLLLCISSGMFLWRIVFRRRKAKMD